MTIVVTGRRVYSVLKERNRFGVFEVRSFKGDEGALEFHPLSIFFIVISLFSVFTCSGH